MVSITMRRLSRPLAYIAAIVTVALLLLWWQHDSRVLSQSISKPRNIWTALATWFSEPMMRDDIFTTLRDALIGFLLCVAIGVVLASALASSRSARLILQPYLSAFNAVPKVALAPIFLLIFGINSTSKVYFIAVSVFFVPFYSLLRGLTATDQSLINHARVIGASRWQMVRDVYAPAVVGTLTATLRVTASFCLISAVIFELLAAQGGIGYVLSLAQAQDAPDTLVSGIIIVAVSGFIADRILVLIEHRFASWRVSA